MKDVDLTPIHVSIWKYDEANMGKPKKKKRRKSTDAQDDARPTPLQDLLDAETVERITSLFSHATRMSASVIGPGGPPGPGGLQGPTFVRDFCRLLRSRPEGLIRCAECDRRVVAEARETRAPAQHVCWAGLHEVAHPIVSSGNALGFLFSGQVRPDKRSPEVMDRLVAMANELGISPGKLIDAYERIPVVDTMEFDRCNKLAAEASRIIAELATLSARAHATLGSASDILSHISIIDWLRSTKQKTVLVLGKDTGEELGLLREIQSRVSKHGYEPILVKDYGDIESMSNEQKVVAFAQASRFVVIENTFPAGQIDECRLCASNRIVTATLRQEGRGSSFMVTDYDLDFPFMKEFVYELGPSGRSLATVVRRALKWAETALQRRQNFFRDKYPWRHPPER